MSPPTDFPPLPPSLQNRTFLGMLGFFGPGAIIVCVTIGSGETVFAARGGAIYGYTMFWCFLAGAICKGIQLYSASRFITLTARGPLQSWMELPGPRGWFVIFLAVMTCIWMPFWLSGLPQMLGDFSNWIVGIPHPADAPGFASLSEAEQTERLALYSLYGRCWGTMYILVAIIFTWLQSYSFLERLQTVIVALLLVCMMLAAAVSNPDWMAMLIGSFVPQVPRYEPWVVEKFPQLIGRSPWVEIIVYVGVIGGGTQDYLGYIGLLREKAWGMLGWPNKRQIGPPEAISDTDENRSLARKWLLAPQIDVGVSVLAIVVFTLCFVTLGATVLNPNEAIPSNEKLLTEQYQFLGLLTQNSPALRWVIGWTYKTGIFFAFFGTILGAYEIYTRTVRECAIALFPQLDTVPLRRFRCWTLFFVGVGGLILLWGLGAIGFDPVTIVTPAALVGSVLTCGLWCFGMLWSDHVHLPKSLRMRAWLRAALLVSGVVLTAGAVIGIYEYVGKLFTSS